MPLRLEDGTAETLLGGLMKRAGELTVARATQPRWSGWLGGTGPYFRVEKRLHLPERLPGHVIRTWVGADDLKPRFRVMLKTPLGTEAIALLTRQPDSDRGSDYRLEWLRRGGLVLTGAAVQQPHLLSLHDGQSEHRMELPGENAWGELPWVFTASGAANDLRWLGEGSVGTRSDHAWVLADDALKPLSETAGAFEACGTVAALPRTVYRISGQVDFLTAENDRYRITCRAEHESDESFSLVGTTLHINLANNPIYRQSSGARRLRCVPWSTLLGVYALGRLTSMRHLDVLFPQFEERCLNEAKAHIPRNCH